MKSLFGIDLFARPEAFLLFAILLGWGYWYRVYFDPRRLRLALSYDPHKTHPPKFRFTFLRHVPYFLLLSGLGAGIVALARPQSASEAKVRYAKGVDILLLMDISGSMEADDFPPNRLEVAKKTAARFIGQRTDDRVGVVLFAEEALTYTPLTLDHDFVLDMVERIHFGMMAKQGTALGNAIAIGINRLRESENPSQIMVLLTDGASNRGQLAPLTAARLARRFGIRIYCIGIGEPPVLQRREDQVELDELTLKSVSKLSGGKYFLAENPQDLARIFSEISSMETSESVEEVYREVSDKYPFFLKISIVLISLSFLSMLTFMYNPLEH